MNSLDFVGFVRNLRSQAGTIAFKSTTATSQAWFEASSATHATLPWEDSEIPKKEF